MEKETFLSGYCRTTDQSRMVEVITESGELIEIDCCYENCIHTPNCSIAQAVKELIKD
jgi:hypothetical protein